MNLCSFIGLVIYSSHKVLKRIIRSFIVLAGLQNQCYRESDCLLMHDALPSYRNGVLPLNQYNPPLARHTRSRKIGLVMLNVLSSVESNMTGRRFPSPLVSLTDDS